MLHDESNQDKPKILLHSKASPLKRAFIFALAFFVKIFYLLYFYTLRIQVVNPQWSHPLLRDFNVIYVCWHSKSFLLIPFGYGWPVAILTLLDDRNLFLDRLLRFLAYKTVPVTSEARATIRLKRYLEKDKIHVLLAVDGPVGPRGIVRPGAEFLSRETGRPIVVMRVEYERSFRIQSRWDQYEVPYPFTRSKVTLNEPIYANDAGSDRLKALLGEP